MEKSHKFDESDNFHPYIDESANLDEIHEREKNKWICQKYLNVFEFLDPN